MTPSARMTSSRCRQPTDALVGAPVCHARAAEVEGDKSEILRLMTACMEARFDLERMDAQLRVAVAALERLRHVGEAFVVASEALEEIKLLENPKVRHDPHDGGK
jgi:hypothetical protein